MENYVDKYCTKCSAKIRSTDAYCVYCGAITGFEKSLVKFGMDVIRISDEPKTIAKPGKWIGDFKCEYHMDGDRYVEITDYRGAGNIVYIPERIHMVLVKEIGEYAFADIQEIETIVFPRQMRTVKRNALEGCRNLKKITLPRSLSFDLKEAGIENHIALELF